LTFPDFCYNLSEHIHFFATKTMTTDAPRLCDFNDVFNAEFDDILERRNPAPVAEPSAKDGSKAKASPTAKEKRTPTTQHGLTGLALSGGGVRSAAFSLGVLQGLHTKDFIRHVDYLSTVSGGGYIGTAMSVGMSSPLDAPDKRGVFPFGQTGAEPGETPETRHLRDNSRYLVQNGFRSIMSAFAIYMRGIVMNCLVLLPFLLFGAAIIIALNPDTKRLVSHDLGPWNLDAIIGTAMPFTVLALLILLVLWIAYAILVSVHPIAPLKQRQRLAKVATIVMVLFGVVLVLESHTWLLRAFFEYAEQIKTPQTVSAKATHVQVFDSLFAFIKNFVVWIGPFIVVVMPFIKTLATKATADATGGWVDLGKRFASRALLIFAAAVVPLALWLVMMQLAYWGTAVSKCPDTEVVQQCTAAIMDSWAHAPEWLQKTLGVEKPLAIGEVNWLRVPLYYVLGAVILYAFSRLLSVNSNSLHQLYRDRLGSAFLVKKCETKQTDRKANPIPVNPDAPYQLEPADTFKLTELNSGAPYHLINAALNVPGSRFANQRGRNADFFLFSRRYVGSEVTGYVPTEAAQAATDGLNIGTAMAISGAAAAPNMGMASMRPLSPTIAFLNVRLGRWLRHPDDIVKWRQSHKEVEKASWWFGTPGPKYLLREAFSKSGRKVGEVSPNGGKSYGFVFLTDGGHIENLGVYELLRRRCALIIAVDGEADPDLDGGSLVQLERFARIDLGVRIAMDWKPIADRSRKVSDDMKKKNAVEPDTGPHVALGMIDYPPVKDGGLREKGVLVYIKSSLSGDENDYVMAYKAGHAEFPHETTLDQFFSEEQFEVYRALGEHIARGFLEGRDAAAAAANDRAKLLEMVKKAIPGAAPRCDAPTP